MIVHREVMANGSNPHSSNLQVNTLLNHRLKLPPITTSFNRRLDDSRSSRGHGDGFDLPASNGQELTLPSVKFNVDNSESFTETDVAGPAEIKGQSLSFSRVYTVLPPIGGKFVPSTPLAKRATVNIPNAPTSVRKSKRSTRRARVKKQPDEKVENVSKSNAVVDNVDVIKTTCDSEKANESFSIEIADSVSPTAVGEVNHARSENETEKQDSSTSTSVRGKPNGEKPKPDTIYTTITASVSTRDAYSDNELWPESPFPQFSTVPDDLRLYADVYPPSPPPSDRRARNVVEKTRELLAEENGFRVSFMEDIGHHRRNATCAELDNALKNAVQQLRDVFLRKTMEELCMSW